MRKQFVSVGAVVVVAIAVALAYGGWRMLESERQQICTACSRPLHSQARAVALVEGERHTFCCPACAFMDRRQTGHGVELLELTDYNSDSPINPQDAFLVVGSRVNHCLHVEPVLDQHKRASQLEFDRCSPSVLAFSREADARDFMAENGGTFSTFDELATVLR